MDLGLNVTVLTRDCKATASKLGAYESDPLHLIQSDFSDHEIFEFPKNIVFTHIVHGAISTTKSHGNTSSKDLAKTSKNGANTLIERASFQGNKPVFMHLSSGAVYGPQPLTLPRIPSEWLLGAGNEVISAYALAKINTETLVREAHEKAIIRGANPRLFSFFGPHLPIDQQFAIGNFIQDVVLNRDITVSGNPQTSRSYLYPTDLVNALLIILTRPTMDTIQVGSSKITTMGELATLISNQFGGMRINYLNPTALESRYVPEMDSSEKTYKFVQKVSIEEGLARWRRWLNF
jgi:nucleoside-diphosphate-sugar epimerase